VSGLFQRADAGHDRVVLLAQESPEIDTLVIRTGAVMLLNHPQILSGAKGSPRTGQDDTAHAVVALSGPQRRRQLEAHLLIEGVERIRPIKCDRQNAALGCNLNRAELRGHQLVSRGTGLR